MGNTPFRFFEKPRREASAVQDVILSVSHLVKRYGSFTAVDDISFDVKRKALFAFLGENGAGKSTTINIITSILSKDAGKVILDGYDQDFYSDVVKSEVGIVFQNSVLDPLLSPVENLSIRAGFYGIVGKAWSRRLAKLSEMLELTPFLHRPVGHLSGGQRRRVDIARAMLHDPKLLILDEPTTGLDPQTRLSVWDLVDDLREKTGMTVFLTTHYMEEAEKASYALIVDRGRIIAQGTPHELKSEYSGDYVLAYGSVDAAWEERIRAEGRRFFYNRDAGHYRILVKDSSDALAFLEGHRDVAGDFEVLKGSMDDVFLNITGARQYEEGRR